MLGSQASAVTESIPPAPPEGLEIEFDKETGESRLNWSAPDDEDVFYNVYHNGVVVNSTDMTSSVEKLVRGPISNEVYGVYYVTSVSRNSGLESSPSNIELEINSPICSLVSITVKPSQYPFVFWGLDQACKEGWERFVNELIIDLERWLGTDYFDPIVVDNLRL